MWVYGQPIDSGHMRFDKRNFISTAHGNSFIVNDLGSYVMLLFRYCSATAQVP